MITTGSLPYRILNGKGSVTTAGEGLQRASFEGGLTVDSARIGDELGVRIEDHGSPGLYLQLGRNREDQPVLTVVQAQGKTTEEIAISMNRLEIPLPPGLTWQQSVAESLATKPNVSRVYLETGTRGPDSLVLSLNDKDSLFFTRS